jgi:(S)-2-hydroxyglutarate dehydrogenase
VTDFALVCQKYTELIAANGTSILTSAAVECIRRSAQKILVETGKGVFATRSLINCAGLYSDRIARMAGGDPGIMIVPLHGEYYDLTSERASLIRALIYPVPDPQFPFLGVHFTRRISGNVNAGPNVVLALAREEYRHTDVSLGDLASSLGFPGFWRMARKHWRNGLGEWHRSLSRRAFVRALQRLVPTIQGRDLVPGGSGVRAQALKPDEALVDDFQFVSSGKVLHILNALAGSHRFANHRKDNCEHRSSRSCYGLKNVLAGRIPACRNLGSDPWTAPRAGSQEHHSF